MAVLAVVVVAAGASKLGLVLHVGPAGGPVAVVAGGQRIGVDLAPNETRELTVPLPLGAKRIVVSVKAARAFRPAEVDPKSDDQRQLGCHAITRSFGFDPVQRSGYPGSAQLGQKNFSFLPFPVSLGDDRSGVRRPGHAHARSIPERPQDQLPGGTAARDIAERSTDLCPVRSGDSRWWRAER